MYFYVKAGIIIGLVMLAIAAFIYFQDNR